MTSWFRIRVLPTLAAAFCVATAPAAAVVPSEPIALTRPAANESDGYADAAAAIKGGGFVLALTRRKTDATGNAVIVQAFGPTGKAQKPAVVVESGDVTLVGVPKVLAIGGDRFLVVWRKETRLYGATYALATNKISPARQLVPSNELLHDMVSLPGGKVALLTSAYDAAGASFQWSTIISSRTLKVISGPHRIHPDGLVGFSAIGLDYAVASLGTGALAVRFDRTDGQLYAQRLARSGKPIGPAVRINATDMQVGALADRGPKTVRAVRLTNGRVLVVWVSLEGNPYIDGFDVRGRIVGANGKPIGPDLHIGGPTGKQTLPDVLALPRGEALVTYASEVQFVSTVRSRHVAANGRLGPDRERVAGATLTFSPDTDLVRIRDGSVVNVLDGGPTGQIGAHGIRNGDF